MKNRKKLKICIIDPNNTIEYTYGLLIELAKNNEVIYFTKKSCRTLLPSVAVKKIFYEDDSKSKIYMGLNYILSYCKIIYYVIRNKADIVHIQWSKAELLDKYIIKLLKHFSTVIYTAHNVLPHVNGNSKKKLYNGLYQTVDKIIVHGKAIKEEMLKEFSIDENKIYIQPYGYCQLEMNSHESGSEFIKKIREKCGGYDKIIMCLGLINRYKGTDRILKIWNENFSEKRCLLVIAGIINEHFEELDHQIAHHAANVIIEDRHLKDAEFSELCTLADLIVLPYRNASMSGVIYAAARSQTAVMTTKVGTIPEYLEAGHDSIVVENNDEKLLDALIKVMDNKKSYLAELGKNLHVDFERKYKWDAIVEDLVEKCYLK